LIQIMNNEMKYLSKIRNWISSFKPLNTNFFATLLWQNLPFFYNVIETVSLWIPFFFAFLY
jgi:hypothetical protein